MRIVLRHLHESSIAEGQTPFLRNVLSGEERGETVADSNALYRHLCWAN